MEIIAWNKMKSGDIVQGCIQPHGENTAWDYKAVSIWERRSSVWIPQKWIETENPGSFAQYSAVALSNLRCESAGPSYNFKFDGTADNLLYSKQFLKIFYFYRKEYNLSILFYPSYMQGPMLDF